MDDTDLSKSSAFLLNLFRAENGSGSNAISVQISQSLITPSKIKNTY